MQFHPHTVRSQTTTPLGVVYLSASPSGLNGCWFEGQKYIPTDIHHWPRAAHHPVLDQAIELLSLYCAGNTSALTETIKLDLSVGSAFQQQVWRALLHIPVGTTSSYSLIAQSIKKPTAYRAVATAIGRNPISLWVPCHRVIGANGHLTGYAGGLQRKETLLQWECANQKKQSS
jgi:methylated-DNA-[protein]-cysteine S-methyltransferase